VSALEKDRSSAPLEIDHADGAWHFTRSGSRLLACERTHDVAGVEVAVEATGPYWYLALVDMLRGTVAFRHGDVRVASPPSRHVVFLPPFSFVQCELEHARRRLRVLISDRALGRGVPQEPVLFATRTDELPTSLEEVRSLLASAHEPASVARQPRPSRLVARAKQLLDAGHRARLDIAEVASRLGVAHPTLTRRFRHELGVTPAAYRAQLRVSSAALMLLDGGEIADTAYGVGFGDLGRFYKQFKAITSVTPARYRPRGPAPTSGRAKRKAPSPGRRPPG
jgi:AraC-like DNA-binding protein